MLSLRLVVDTNIVVSAALNERGLQRTVFLLAISKPSHLFVSAAILDEYRLVLARRELPIRKGLRQQYVQLIENCARTVAPQHRLDVCKDPSDNIFLECAEAARADYLITGNVRHFPKFWKSTKILSSSEFVGLVAPHLFD